MFAFEFLLVAMHKYADGCCIPEKYTVSSLDVSVSLHAQLAILF